jgi:hypothetical protein
MTWLQAGMKKVDAIGAGTTLKIRNHDAMNTLRLGTATRREIDAIIDAMNVAEALCKRGTGSDWLPEIQEAQDHLLAMARLNLGMEVHDAQLEAVTVRELELAMDDVMENLRLKKMRPIVEKINE